MEGDVSRNQSSQVVKKRTNLKLFNFPPSRKERFAEFGKNNREKFVTKLRSTIRISAEKGGIDTPIPTNAGSFYLSKYFFYKFREKMK